MADQSELHKLLRQRSVVATSLSLVVILIYFGFILLIAFNRPLMSTKLADGLSLGILLGALVIIASWALTYVYVRWANAHFDAAVRRLDGRSRS